MKLATTLLVAAALALSGTVEATRSARLWESQVARRSVPMFLETGAEQVRCPTGRTCCTASTGALELCIYVDGQCCDGANAGYCCPSGQTCTGSGGSPSCGISSVKPAPQESSTQISMPSMNVNSPSQPAESSVLSAQSIPTAVNGQITAAAAPAPPKQGGTIILSNGNKITTVHEKK